MIFSTRAGSAILYCLGLSAIVVVIGFGFLRSTMHDSVAGSSSQIGLLAQAAARAGVADATEAVIADYASTSLVVGAGYGSTVTISNPPMFLDGPFRAPFVSLVNPNQLQNVDTNTLDSMNDVRAENPVVNPLLRFGDDTGDASLYLRYDWFNLGIIPYDGRGRYIEPNYRNITRQNPATSTVTVLTTKVLDLNAVPERHNALFLDSSFRRVASDGTSAGDKMARAAARYRLRYALGVIDLGGQLLTNPKADLNYDWQDPNNEYRHPPLWLQEAGEAWYNMAAAFPRWASSGMVSQPLRWQHVFLGRGNTSNYDRQAGTSFPVTFPMMFRINQSPPLAGKGYYWGLYAALLADATGNSETTGLLNIPGTTATPAGGEALKQSYGGDRFTFSHIGPQPSWYTQQQSARGMLANNSASSYPAYPRRDGATYWGEQSPKPDHAEFLPTPFGRGVSTWSGVGTRKWYEGRCNTPWYVNLLTAPRAVINYMQYAYLPPSFKAGKKEENFALKVDPASIPPKTTTDVPATAEYLLGSWQIFSGSSLKGHDLFTRLAGGGFSEWPTPSAGGVDPNFLAPDTRTVSQIYPGKMWNEPGLDNLGKDINANVLDGTAMCSNMGSSFASITVPTTAVPSVYLKGAASPATTPPAGWGSDPNDRFVQRLTSNNSYWLDITSAFNTAIALARAAWVQYPNAYSNAGNSPPFHSFSPSTLRDPNLYDSIEDIDRLFLRQLGEDFDNPGNGIPLAPVQLTVSGNKLVCTQSATAISNTIRTLVNDDLIKASLYSSAERGAIMERVLNDFRMSFFGASPQYVDRFRPFDFDGDGKVMCSCYASTGIDFDKGLDRYSTIEPNVTAYGNRRGLTPVNWFSLTGTFYIGKSHYFRILCRGEVFDNVVQKPVSDATLESVLVVDPEGTDISQSHYLFQRWHFNRYTGSLSLIER